MTQMMGLSRIRNGFWSIQFSNIKSKLCPKVCVNLLGELAANCDANTVFPHIRPAGINFSLGLQMRVLLEITKFHL